MFESHGAFARQEQAAMEIIFEVRDAEEGGYNAHALGQAIFTEAETWDELKANVREATALHFEDAEECPRLIQLHYVKDELIPLELLSQFIWPLGFWGLWPLGQPDPTPREWLRSLGVTLTDQGKERRQCPGWREW